MSGLVAQQQEMRRRRGSLRKVALLGRRAYESPEATPLTPLDAVAPPSGFVAINIHSTISKDNTNGEEARRADLFAHLGKKMARHYPGKSLRQSIQTPPGDDGPQQEDSMLISTAQDLLSDWRLHHYPITNRGPHAASPPPPPPPGADPGDFGAWGTSWRPEPTHVEEEIDYEDKPTVTLTGAFRRRIDRAREEDGITRQQDEDTMRFAADYMNRARKKGDVSRSRSVQPVTVPEHGVAKIPPPRLDGQQVTRVPITHNNDSHSDSYDVDISKALDELSWRDFYEAHTNYSASSDDEKPYSIQRKSLQASGQEGDVEWKKPVKPEIRHYPGHGVTRDNFLDRRLRTAHSGPDLRSYDSGLTDSGYGKSPVTKASLGDLDVAKIIHNPKLRHDINFDPDLHFGPELDGWKGQRKQDLTNLHEPPKATGPSQPSLPLDLSRPFACIVCTRRFYSHEDVESHYHSIHSQQKPFECRECGKKFSRADNLAQHVRTHGSGAVVMNLMDGADAAPAATKEKSRNSILRHRDLTRP